MVSKGVDKIGVLWDFYNMVAGVEFSPQEKKAKKLAVLNACYNGAFTLAEACEVAGLARYTAWEWMRADDDFREAWDLAKQQAYDDMLDLCERQLIANVKKGDNTAMIFFLKTQGARRGFQENMRIDSTVTHTIDVDEAARRIAFAMNAAIDRGETIEGSFTEVLPTEEQSKRDEVRALAAGAGVKMSVGRESRPVGVKAPTLSQPNKSRAKARAKRAIDKT